MHTRELKGLRVAFVAGTLGQGGAEQQLFYMVRALHEAGADVRVLCLTQGEFWEQRLRALGIVVCFIGQRASRLSRVARLVRELRASRPHVVQSQHFYANLYAVVAARLLQLPEIGAIRNDALSEVRANGHLGSWSLKLPRVIAANSRVGMANAASLGVPPARVRFLPNVVDTEHFVPPTIRTASPIRLLAVGRLTEQKRFDRFLDVLAAVRVRSGLDVRATIAGIGPLRAPLEAQAAALGLGADVLHFAGAVADMRSVYQQADVLVLTSQWEGTPNVVMEAMASGLAVVSTPVGGVPDLIRDGTTGVLVDGTDPATFVDAFSNTLLRLIAEPGSRQALGSAARQSIVANSSVQALPRLLGALYASVLA